MYRVLLVDDESMARVGLRSTFDWKGNGFDLVGEASNGQKAMKWIENEEIDILITDIAMPVMDGLELTRRTRELCPWVKVLLLSCHNDFEYVREGIRLGASDYLLKPTLEAENLKEILEVMKDQVNREKERLDLYDKMMGQQARERKQEIETSVTELIAGESTTDLAAILPWMKEGYRIAACMLETGVSGIPPKGKKLAEAAVAARELFYNLNKQGISFVGAANELVLLLPARFAMEGMFFEELEKIQAYFQKNGLWFSMGVSRFYVQPADVRNAYQEGINGAQSRFFHGPGGIHPQASESCKNNREQYIRNKNNLKEFIISGFKAKSAECLEMIVGLWTQECKTVSEVIQEAQELVSLFYNYQEDNVSAVHQIETVRSMEYVEEVRQLVWDDFMKIWSTPKQDEENSLHQRIINQAIVYIKTNYTTMISLQDVADHVCMSRNYFSELFKRITGQNFIDYLIRLRLKHAVELLQTSRLKVYEVAEASGFNDVKYFSKLFKKIIGLSPAEYQGIRRDAD